MEKELKKIQAVIFGKNYTFATDDNESDVLFAVQYVDKKMKEIASAMNTNDGYVTAVMLALELAKELKQNNDSLGILQQKVLKLGNLLDSELA
ncbi:cell division protein ZapA [Candidatus Dependentiae bacterium]|nr:cell division protein ZapA [Candidatus Dependentiae bacterium]MBU4387072.1 cell division protein ZapA [Candidatus Dependentiae bacterium]MCG2756224.1 cell division protein ZapA [Candidatus Dependentiae bacterium]